MERFLKLFAIVLLAFGIFILSGCTEGTKPIAFKETENFKTLNHVTYPNLKAETNPVSDDVVAALKTLPSRPSRISLRKEGRTMYTLL